MAGSPPSEPFRPRPDNASPAWRRWVHRYGPAEVVRTLAGVSAGTAAAPFGGVAAVGIVASWAETVGFYGTMAWRELSRRLRPTAGGQRPGRVLTAFATTAALLAEFGPA